MDRGAWWATVHGVTKELDVIERLTQTKISKLISAKVQRGRVIKRKTETQGA